MASPLQQLQEDQSAALCTCPIIDSTNGPQLPQGRALSMGCRGSSSRTPACQPSGPRQLHRDVDSASLPSPFTLLIILHGSSRICCVAMTAPLAVALGQAVILRR